MYEEIKRNIRIGDVLMRYGISHPGRDSYRIPCPIHHGSDSNFSVSERDGLWNCFSVCGRGGSVIDLVAALDGTEVQEAVKKLSKEFHFTPMETGAMVAREYVRKNERFSKLSERVPEEIVKLPELAWLEEGFRNLKATTIQHWGLARVAEGIFIPVVNARGQVCSYAVRRNDGNPKYDNAAGISKCMPYGLYENKADIIKQGFAFIVEGQFDAIALWQKDYRNVVALMGSSMTEQQAMLILAVTSNLTLVMDGDEPGRQAAAKIKKQWSNVFDITIFNLPEGVDPDEFEGILEK